MASDSVCNRIISRMAEETLTPLGMFQKGNSRVWIDDNGWYLTVVEFQPGAGGLGTYLNVGIHYLWDRKEHLSFDYGYRESGLVTFSADETAFHAQMRERMRTALKKVRQYRKFANVQYAKKKIVDCRKNPNGTHGLYHKMMICGLCGDPHAKDYYDQLVGCLVSAQLDWEKEYHRELSNEIAPIIQNTAQMHAYICNKIMDQRGFWRTRSNLKELSEVFSF